uniref:CW domain-containing protein n=1 Tax=Panagrellus redivivus TaxID=6233 RepID=A0A7E4VRG7_PANRE
MACIDECITYDNCFAIQMEWGMGTCNLLTMIRDYTWEEAQCSYFVRNDATVKITGRSLDGMDQVIQNVVYASKNVCPDGWTVDSDSEECALTLDESVCDEYAAFLGACYDGTDCLIPLLNETSFE